MVLYFNVRSRFVHCVYEEIRVKLLQTIVYVMKKKDYKDKVSTHTDLNLKLQGV